MPSPRRTARRRARRSSQRGTLLLVGAFVVLIAANVYYFGFRRGTSVRDLVRLSQDKELATLTIQQAQQAKRSAATQAAPKANSAKPGAQPATDDTPVVDDSAAESGRVVTGSIPEAGTLASVLRAEEVPPVTVAQVATALRPLFDPHGVRAGHGYTLRFDDEDHLSAFEYRPTPVTLYRVERHADAKGTDRWHATKETAPLDVKVAAVSGTVESSLYDAVKKSGEGTALVATLIDLFAWDINFYTDTQPGDRFRLLVEKQYLGERFYKYGRVLAAEYAGRAGTWHAFWHAGPGPDGGAYYDEQGRAVAKSMLKTPLKYVRVSSRFDRHRFHPVLHTERAHLGVDYAAPVGTPVWATTNGKVRFRGKRGGAGNCVVIAHPGGMESIYMHLSRFANGLREGQAVRQKQVIGYVGQTGLATGPHLHFSVKMGGHYVDPLRLKPAREAPLPASERERFQAEVKERLAALSRTDSTPRPAEAFSP